MVDTVHLWLSYNEVGKPFDLNQIGNELTNCEEKIKNGNLSISGNLSNLRIYASSVSMKISGSLPKYLLGDNLQVITRSGIEEACMMLSESLHTNISLAKISRVDVACNLITTHKPKNYLPFLQEHPKLFRSASGTSLLYSNKSKTITFYDKIGELGRSFLLPDCYANKYVLRYETRWKKAAAKQLKQPGLNFGMLHDERVYINLIDKWADEYHAINKRGKILTLGSMKIETPNDIVYCLAAMKAQELGNDVLMNFVNELKSNKVFKHSKDNDRVKNKFKELLKFNRPDETFEMTNELGQKIEMAKQHYR